MAQLMHLQFPLGDGHHLLPPLLPPHALAADELLDDCTLFGSLAGSLLPTPLQPLPAGAPGLPAPGALPLPLSVDDIFECVAATSPPPAPVLSTRLRRSRFSPRQGLGRGGRRVRL